MMWNRRHHKNSISTLQIGPLSYNLRSLIAAKTYAMYNNCHDSPHVHNEATKLRQKRAQEELDGILLTTFQRCKMFAWVLAESCHIKDLATEETQNPLLCARGLVKKQVNTFVEERMIVPKQGIKPDVLIHASLHKCNVKESKDKDKELS